MRGNEGVSRAFLVLNKMSSILALNTELFFILKKLFLVLTVSRQYLIPSIDIQNPVGINLL